MYLVVARSQPLTLADALGAAVQATLRCRDEYARDARYAETFAAWAALQRKVTLRARDSQWQALLAAFDVAVADRSLCLALPARRRDTLEALLRRLQVYSADEADLPAGELHPTSNAPVMVLAADRQMSVGKLMAQVSHAAAMLADAAWFDTGLWRQAGYPIGLAQADRGTWDSFAARGDGVLVRDAGLTEIAAGTETVLALADTAPGLTALTPTR